MTRNRGEGYSSARNNALIGNFQASLETLRLKRGLNRRGFAELIGVPQSSYFNLISDKANPCLETIANIASRAGVDPCELLQPRDGSYRTEHGAAIEASAAARPSDGGA